MHDEWSCLESIRLEREAINEDSNEFDNMNFVQDNLICTLEGKSCADSKEHKNEIKKNIIETDKIMRMSGKKPTIREIKKKIRDK